MKNSSTSSEVYAQSFYPQWAKERVIYIGEVFQSLYNKLGCLRHEVGHTLGFAHEDDIRDQDEDKQPVKTQGGARMPLTAGGDPDSVMSYEKIFGDNAKREVTELSAEDEAKFQEVYNMNIATGSLQVYEMDMEDTAHGLPKV